MPFTNFLLVSAATIFSYAIESTMYEMEYINELADLANSSKANDNYGIAAYLHLAICVSESHPHVHTY